MSISQSCPEMAIVVGEVLDSQDSETICASEITVCLGVHYDDNDAHKYENLQHLENLYDNDNWGGEENVIYTHEMSKCKPTHEELMTLELTGRTLRGKIIMQDNTIYDADKDRDVDEILSSPEKIESVLNIFIKKAHQTVSLSVNVKPIKCFTLSNSKQYPNGTYELNETSVCAEDVMGVPVMRFCDDKTCLNVCTLGARLGMSGSYFSREDTIAFFSQRSIYTIKDEVNGNFELCHCCIMNDSAKKIQRVYRQNK